MFERDLKSLNLAMLRDVQQNYARAMAFDLHSQSARGLAHPRTLRDCDAHAPAL
jgi:hypothetical protein